MAEEEKKRKITHIFVVILIIIGTLQLSKRNFPGIKSCTKKVTKISGFPFYLLDFLENSY